ncbi:MAG: hypothetical protein LBK99_06455, partial [Opitutaceae bacterium]|nr:hypothetical protein [Opitutaceae bacterium]
MTRHHALLLALVMQASSLHAGPSLNDAKLTGTTTVPDGSTLTITNGGTLAAEPGATVTGLATPADLPPPPRYAIFILPIGGDFTDFELKATQSNFGEHAPFTDLYFYYHSPDPARQSVSGQTGP